MAKLLFTGSGAPEGAFQCTRSRTLVGRADDNQLVIRDPSVSAHHCEILVHGGEVIVRDLGSSNGTFVNGVRLVNQQAPVRNGTVVRFGCVEARVEIGPQEMPPADTEITAIYGHGRALRESRGEGQPPGGPKPSSGGSA